MKIRYFLPLWFAGAALPVGACQISSNLVLNCGFDDDLAHWTAVAGTCSHNAAVGGAKAGSAACNSAPLGAGAHWVQIRQCVSDAAPGIYRLAGYARREADRAIDCSVDVEPHALENCGSASGIVSTQLVPAVGKFVTSLPKYLALPAEATAVSVEVVCFSSSAFSVLLDDVLFGSDLIFVNGFDFTTPVLTAGATLNYVENAVAVADDTVTVTDADSVNLASATVSISGNFQTGQDVLACGDCGALVPVYTPGSSVLTLTGSATLAAYQAALRSVTYENLSDDPNTLTRTMTWTVNDGNSTSSAVTSTVNVAAVNDPPTATNDTVSTNEDVIRVLATSDFGTYSDLEFSPLAAVRITLLESDGDLEFDTSGAGGWTDVTLNQNVSAAHIVAGRLRFIPDLDENGSPYTTIGFRVSDGTVLSTAAYTLTLSVTPVNDPPTSNNDIATTSEDVILTLVSSNFGFYTDVEGTPLASVRITMLETDGDLEFDLTGVGSWVNVTLNQDITAAELAAGRLRFVPFANENGNPYAIIGFRVSDGTALSSFSYTLSIAVSPVNDPPTSTNDTAATNEDVTLALATTDFGTYTDLEGTPLASLRITTLESDGNLEFDTTGTGGWAAVTLNQDIAAADVVAGRLRFVPDLNENGSPYATIGFRVSDGTALSVTNYTLTLNVTSVNDAPTSNNDTATTDEDVILMLDTDAFGAYADLEGAPLASVRLTTLESNGDLEFDTNGAGAWTDVTLNQDVSAAHMAAGRLRFVPDMDENGSPYATIGFRVSDGALFSVPAYTLTINVLPVAGGPGP